MNEVCLVAARQRRREKSNESGIVIFWYLSGLEPGGSGRVAMNARILLVEEHSLVAVGLELALSDRDWDVQTSSGPTIADVVAHSARFKPQCVLVDLHIGGRLGSGVELIAPLVATGARVLVLTAERRRLALARLIDAGAEGWIGKGVSLDVVDATLRRALDGEGVLGRADRATLLEELRRERAGTALASTTFEHLTRREAIVLRALIDGQSAVEIAEANFVSLATVRSQIRSVLQKLGVRSQLAAVALASIHQELLPEQSGRDVDRRQRTRAS